MHDLFPTGSVAMNESLRYRAIPAASSVPPADLSAQLSVNSLLAESCERVAVWCEDMVESCMRRTMSTGWRCDYLTSFAPSRFAVLLLVCFHDVIMPVFQVPSHIIRPGRALMFTGLFTSPAAAAAAVATLSGCGVLLDEVYVTTRSSCAAVDVSFPRQAT